MDYIINKYIRKHIKIDGHRIHLSTSYREIESNITNIFDERISINYWLRENVGRVLYVTYESPIYGNPNILYYSKKGSKIPYRYDEFVDGMFEWENKFVTERDLYRRISLKFFNRSDMLEKIIKSINEVE